MKRRSIRNVPNVGEADLIERILSIRNRRIKAYACFVYLFGNRVSEGIGLPATTHTGEYWVYTKTLKRRDKDGNAIIKTIRIPKFTVDRDDKGMINYDVEPLQAWRMEYDKETQTLYCRGVATLKTVDRPPRDVYVLADGPGERPLVDFLWGYVQDVRKKQGEFAPLFPLTRQSVYRSFRHYLGANAFPHKLRDLRATKDATTYGLDAKDLQEKFNWSRPDMAMYYGRKNKSDVIAKMRRSTHL